MFILVNFCSVYVAVLLFIVWLHCCGSLLLVIVCVHLCVHLWFFMFMLRSFWFMSWFMFGSCLVHVLGCSFLCSFLTFIFAVHAPRRSLHSATFDLKTSPQWYDAGRLARGSRAN